MFRNLFLKVQAYMAMKSKVAEARALYRKDGKRRFIIPFRDGTMEILTKNEALALKAAGRIASDLTAKTIYNACFFYTDTNVSHEKVQCEMPMWDRTRRLKSFYSWFNKHHNGK